MSAYDDAVRDLAEMRRAKTEREQQSANGHGPRPGAQRSGTGQAGEKQAPGHNQKQQERARGVWITASKVTITPPQWLWERYILRGHLNMLAGDGDVGKSFMTMKMVAHVTTGTPWPDKSPCQRAACIVVPGEDDESTIAGRLGMMNGDLDRLHILRGIAIRAEDEEQDDPLLVRLTLTKALHVHELETKIKLTGAQLVIVDPVESFLEAGTRTQDGVTVRTITNPLSDLARRTGCTILVVAHFNKATLSDAIHRVSGNQAWFNAPRAALCAGHDPESEDGRRLLLPYKMNLAEKPSGWGYRILADGGVTWDGPATMTSKELLGPQPDAQQKEGKKDLARKIVAALLGAGQQSASLVYGVTRAAEISDRTVETAKVELGIKTYKTGSGKTQHWWWQLPEPCQQQEAADGL